MLLLAEQNTPIFMFPLVDVFVFLFTSAKIVQAERNTKQIHLFLSRGATYLHGGSCKRGANYRQ